MLRVLKWLVALAFTVAAAVGAVLVLATYEELTADLPPIDRLLEYDPPVATRVYADDGSLIEEFFRERRYRVPIEQIPPLVRNAFLAAEDADFFSHRGVDFLGIIRAAVANLQAGSVVQGASTITQQVVKALLLTPERSYERKLKEILLSVRLEQQLSKNEILELYLNQIYLGDGNHGVGAAARNYYGKSIQQLTAAEAAMLAGLPAAPSRYSPNRAPEAARKRQLYVLRRMLEEQFLTPAEYQAAVDEELRFLTRREQPTASVRNYYTETIRLQLEDMFGAEAPYNQGYSVYTAMQPRLQAMADAAVRNGIERIDKALGYRGPVAHLTPAEQERQITETTEKLSGSTLDSEHLYQAVVTRVQPKRLTVRLGPWEREVDTSSVRWSWRVRTNRAFQVGDVVEVRTRENATASIEETEPEAEPEALYIGQTPQIEAALVAIDMDHGGIAAMVGGYDFLSSQFNRALQAKRQPGSAFKPFVYAAALDHGHTAATILYDSPVEYWDHDKFWAPRNYTRDFKGPIRLRAALEQSRNVVSVKLVDKIGPKTVVEYLDRFHLEAKFGPNLSIALGTNEMTLRDITEGYTAFANRGVKVEPVMIRRIEDKEGIAFFSDQPRRREVLSPQTAAIMTYILEGVVQRGTAKRVKALGRPAAGKTGTTNEQRDAWFLGYTPSLAVGVWVGFDDQTMTMGKMGTGGQVAAPIWLDFMEAALEGAPVRDFEMPDGIQCVNIDPWSGTRAGEWTSKPFLECFKAGTAPNAAPPLPPEEPGLLGGGGPIAPGTGLENGPVGGAGSDPRWPAAAGDAPIAPLYPYNPNPSGAAGPAGPAGQAGQAGQAGEGSPSGDVRYRAAPVPTESGTEIRLFRETAPAPAAPTPTAPPRAAPVAPLAAPPAAPAPEQDRLWAPPADAPPAPPAIPRPSSTPGWAAPREIEVPPTGQATPP